MLDLPHSSRDARLKVYNAINAHLCDKVDVDTIV